MSRVASWVLGDRRQLAQRHAEVAEDRARLQPAQARAVAGRQAAVAEAVRHLIEHAEEPVLAVGQGAVEIEQGEAIAHATPADPWARRLCSRLRRLCAGAR
jgi:hypothetical protein